VDSPNRQQPICLIGNFVSLMWLRIVSLVLSEVAEKGRTVREASMGDLEPTLTRPGGWVLSGIVDLLHVCREGTFVARINILIVGRLIGTGAGKGVNPLAGDGGTSLDDDFLVRRLEATINFGAIACQGAGRDIGDRLWYQAG